MDNTIYSLAFRFTGDDEFDKHMLSDLGDTLKHQFPEAFPSFEKQAAILLKPRMWNRCEIDDALVGETDGERFLLTLRPFGLPIQPE